MVSCTASPWITNSTTSSPPFTAPPTTTFHGNLNLRASTEVVLKAKHFLHAFVVKHAGRLAGAFAGARSALARCCRPKLRRRAIVRKQGKEPCGGGATPTQHLNLLPDGAMPSSEEEEPEAGGAGVASYYYDSSWNAVIPAEQLPPMIPGRYLEWPEECEVEEGGCNEIDRLAERFIARCHERFVLEKQESYRRFQEMLARSL